MGASLPSLFRRSFPFADASLHVLSLQKQVDLDYDVIAMSLVDLLQQQLRRHRYSTATSDRGGEATVTTSHGLEISAFMYRVVACRGDVRMTAWLVLWTVERKPTTVSWGIVCFLVLMMMMMMMIGTHVVWELGTRDAWKRLADACSFIR
jgi:hypothetical protein